MIRYRRLYESENSDIKLYDVVRCAGHLLCLYSFQSLL